MEGFELFDLVVEEMDASPTVEIRGIVFDRKQDAITIAAILADHCDSCDEQQVAA